MSFTTSFSPTWLILTEETPLSSSQTENDNISVTIFPTWYKELLVGWSVPPEFGECIFNVYFSQTEDGPYLKINPTPITGTYLKDITTHEYSKFDKGWYKVEAVLLDKGSVCLTSPPMTWDTYQRDWVGIRAAEIQRREYLLLSKFVGVKSFLFRKRSYGKRCTNCWDPTIEQVTNDHCPYCLGTSFEGGYFDAAPLYLQYETTPNSRDKVYFGKFESNQIGAWTISVPVVNSEDVIVREGDWAMYRVDRIMTTELQANTVRQIMTLTQLAKGDVEYQLIQRQLPEFKNGYKLVS